MKILFQYGNGVLNLPAAVASVLSRADRDALRVLLAAASLGSGEIEREELMRVSGCDEHALEAALAFWRGTGLLELSDAPAAPSKRKKAKEAPNASTVDRAPAQEKPESPEVVVRPSATALPAYTTEELASILERRRELTALIDECSNAFGKPFTNAHEIGQLIGLSDYLRLEDEYIVLLLAHCAKMGKKSMRYVVNTAIGLYDEGITDTAALQECLKQREQRESAHGQLRAMFGIGSRALTTKEKKMFDAWLNEHAFPMETIRMAYEKTVNATGKAPVPYANSILERWAASGLKTPEQITQAEAEYERQSNAPKMGNSFDTDDFFNAALQRSFGDGYFGNDTESKQ